MNTAFVVAESMNLIDNDILQRLEQVSAAFRGQQQVKRFRGGDQNVGRLVQHGSAYMRRRITGTHSKPDRCRLNVTLPGFSTDLFERCFQVLMNIIVERFQRRNIQVWTPDGFWSNSRVSIFKDLRNN